MSSTSTYSPTPKDDINSGKTGLVSQGIGAMKVGTMLTKIKVVAASLTAAASFDITAAAFLAKCTVTGITLKSGETLPPIGQIVTLRKVAGAQAANCIVTDAGGTATAGSATVPAAATLSDDGKTIGFETGAAVTAFTFEYYPAAAATPTGYVSTGP